MSSRLATTRAGNGSASRGNVPNSYVRAWSSEVRSISAGATRRAPPTKGATELAASLAVRIEPRLWATIKAPGFPMTACSSRWSQRPASGFAQSLCSTRTASGWSASQCFCQCPSPEPLSPGTIRTGRAIFPEPWAQHRPNGSAQGLCRKESRRLARPGSLERRQTQDRVRRQKNSLWQELHLPCAGTSYRGSEFRKNIPSPSPCRPHRA